MKEQPLSGQALRDIGMNQSLDHANQTHEKWSEEAFKWLRLFIDTMPDQQFFGEDVREFAEKNGFASPPSLRAWGSILVRAKIAGLIRKVGYGQVNNPRAHRANAAIWRRVEP